MNVNGNNNKIIQGANNSTIYIIDGKEVSLPRHLSSSPPIPDNFFGRENELQEIHNLLFHGKNLLLLVNGEGGIGKTTLAAKYYQQYDATYQHLAWVFAERNLADALLMLARPMEIDFPPEMEAKERLDILLQKMRNLPKPCLLVIDNANDLTSLNEHYTALRKCPNFHILLTSRITEFEEIKPLKIEGLPPAQALELFKKHYPKHAAAEDALFYAIHAAVGANTLVLELIAKNLRENNKLKLHYSLADLAADIQKGLLHLRHTKEVLSDWYKGGKADVKEIIRAMYDLSGLSAQERAVLSVFAVLPAEAIAFEVLEDLLTNTPNLSENFLSLAQKGWLEYKEEATTFKISSVIQEMCKIQNATSLLGDSEDLINNLIDKLAYEGGIGHFINVSYAQATLFAHYAESVVSSFEIPHFNTGVLYDRIGEYHKTTGNLPQAFFYREKGIKIYKELCKSYPENADYKNGLAISYQNLGDTHTSLGNLEKALAYYEDYAQLRKKLYEAYPANVNFKNGLAISYSKLGETHTSLGNLEKALAYYEERSQLGKELYEAYPANVSFKNGLAISYGKLGDTYTDLGNLEKALAYYEDYVQLKKELYEAYPANVGFKNGLAVSYAKLGVFYRDNLKEKEKARTHFLQAEELWQELVVAAPLYVMFQKYLGMVQNILRDL
jgi:tetratricopeptide (TPR) repeat protein